MARLKFREGIGTQTDVIDAQTQLTVTRDRFLSAIINYNQSYVHLIRQVSNLSNNGLQDLLRSVIASYQLLAISF